MPDNRRKRVRLVAAVLAVSFLAVGCASEAGDDDDRARSPGASVTTDALPPAIGVLRSALAEVEMTQSYPCGYGFQASNTAQTVGVFLEIVDPERKPPTTSELPHSRWRATLVQGEHLFANWCDDVIEIGDPASEEMATLPIVEGTVTFDGPVPAFDDYGARVVARVSGLVVELGDGSRVALLDDVLVNNNWGGAAG